MLLQKRGKRNKKGYEILFPQNNKEKALFTSCLQSLEMRASPRPSSTVFGPPSVCPQSPQSSGAGRAGGKIQIIIFKRKLRGIFVHFASTLFLCTTESSGSSENCSGGMASSLSPAMKESNFEIRNKVREMYVGGRIPNQPSNNCFTTVLTT